MDCSFAEISATSLAQGLGLPLTDPQARLSSFLRKM
eukprot:CAMPEP_0181201806 /NCGR_PEP_ID=MMETSP1096-20121128/18498_1 /TAXON_ID=156174 ORGANISM="Chrysochromulina ericina, Strain CCMP281" /NCGR_SAMPLE_ID=MMETSP1096 /ASSEMBLY_ACC=CAM_ASM_000453 /LENGTH=35 /DNA_ID= /DNA_START= /DNA_END= /DNA_ORIENTATION=